MDWVLTSERLPEIGALVIYYFEPVGMHLGQFKSGTCQGDAVFVSRAGFLTGDVTHWLPVPPLPKVA